jgi:hypothetical protein
MDVEGLPHVSHRNTLRAAAGALTFRHGATLNLRLLDCHPGKNAEHGQEQRPLCERQPQINEKKQECINIIPY